MKSHTVRNATLIAAPLVLNLILAATPFIPFTKGIWEFDKPQDFYPVLATLVGVDFAILYAAFGFLFLFSSADIKEVLTDFSSRLPATRIARVTDVQFYRDFLSACETARSSVRIAYLSPNPPTLVAPRDREHYYEAIAELMRRRENVQFFRLIRYSDANLEWITGFLRDFDGVPNVSVAVIKDLDDQVAASLGLSVQVVDRDRAWLVALGGHERRGEYRDIAVENEVLAEGITLYYERLWSLADDVLTNGRPTEYGQKLAREFAKRR